MFFPTKEMLCEKIFFVVQFRVLLRKIHDFIINVQNSQYFFFKCGVKLLISISSLIFYLIHFCHVFYSKNLTYYYVARVHQRTVFILCFCINKKMDSLSILLLVTLITDLLTLPYRCAVDVDVSGYVPPSLSIFCQADDFSNVSHANQRLGPFQIFYSLSSSRSVSFNHCHQAVFFKAFSSQYISHTSYLSFPYLLHQSLEVPAIFKTAWLVLLAVQSTLIILLMKNISVASGLLLISKVMFYFSHPYSISDQT